jgi:hypothetical protein
VKLYLDDVRPCPIGWTLARTVKEAIQRVEMAKSIKDPFEAASLDHDLGACDACHAGPQAWWNEGGMPFCDHVGTGSTFVDWMIETGNWPIDRPTVHSMNPVGRRRMQVAIDRYFVPPTPGVVE